MSRFTIHLLGTPTVVGDDDLGLPLGKPLAALCYLALENSRVTREDLASVLWEGAPRARARASVRQALWLLRSRTSEEIIVEGDDGIQLNLEVVGTDVTALENAIEENDPDTAWSLWNGGVMLGLSIPDAQPWQAWADVQRGRLERRLGDLLEQTALNAVGEERLSWIERAIEVRPYRDTVHLQLAETLLELHRPGDAETALARLETISDESNPEGVQRLRAKIRAMRRDPFDGSSGSLQLEFVGRAEPFSRLMTDWRSALSGRSRLVGLVGAEGIGKSRFTREFVTVASHDGANVVEVQAVRSERHLDFGVATSLVRSLLRLRGAAGISLGASEVLGGLVPSSTGQGVEVTPPAPTLVADSVADLFEAISEEEPLVVVVEDVHWCDRVSLNVLLRAMRHVRDARLLLLLTCRTETEDPASVETLRAGRDAGHATLIHLQSLSHSEVAELLGLLLHETNPVVLDRIASRLHGASGGNPLHLESIIHTLRDSGRLRSEASGEWTLDAPENLDDLVVPHSMDQTVERRLAALAPDARVLANELARSERPLFADELLGRALMTQAAGAAPLGELMTQDIVRWTSDDRIAFVHESTREHLAATLGTPSGGGRGRVVRLVGGLAAALLLILVAIQLVSSAPHPFDGHVIWLRAANQFLRVAPDAGDGWALAEVIPEPVELVPARAPFRDSLGRWVFHGYSVFDPRLAPDAVLYRDGVVDTLFATVGDDNLVTFDPTRTAALLNVQHPDTARYRTTIVRLDMATGDTTTLASGALGVSTQEWTADGSRILATVDAPWDSALVLRPDGGRVEIQAAPARELLDFTPCGREEYLLQALEPGSLPRTWLWSPGRGMLDLLLGDGLPGRTVFCSPDGDALAYVTTNAPAGALVVSDREGRRLGEITLDIPGARVVAWDPPTNTAPSGIDLRTGPLLLQRGDTARLRAVVSGSGDEPVEAPVEWAPRDPAIASVYDDGLVWANRPGRTWVRASVHGWITDSVLVTVEASGAGRGILLTDSFPTLDETRWQPWGDPLPLPVLDDEGRPALDMRGDGRFTDGLISQDDFRLDQGGSLEVSFNLEAFTRRDRQRIAVCLMEADPGSPLSLSTAWTVHQRACVTWPAAQLADFDPDRLRVRVNGAALGALPLDGRLRAGDWHRLVVGVRPDGRVTIAVDDEPILESPARVRNTSDVRWRVAILNAAQDTRVLVRDVTLWDQERPQPAGAGEGD